MCAVGDGGRHGNIATMGNHGASAGTAVGGVSQVVVGDGSAGLLGVDLAGFTDIQIFYGLFKLESGFCQDLFLQVVASHQCCIDGEESAGGSVRTGIKYAGVGIAGNDGDPIHGQLQNFHCDLSGDGVKAGAQVSATAVNDDGAVGFQLGNSFCMVQAGEAGALHDHSKALADLPVGIVGLFLLAPVDHFTALCNSFFQTAGADGNNITFTAFAQTLEDLKHVAFFNMVLGDHILVVHTQLLSQLCHSHHETIGALGGAVALICACRGSVGVEDLQVIAHVVDLEQRQGLGTAIHGNRQTVVAIGAGICANFHEDSGNGAVLLTAHLHAATHGMTGGVGNKFFLTGVAVVNGLAGGPCGISGQFFYQNVLLTAVAATYALLDNVDLVLGNAADPAADTAEVVGNLCRGIDDQTATFHMSVANMGFQRSVLDLSSLIGHINDLISLCKALLHISDMTLVGGGDILLDVCMEGELINNLAFTLVTCTGIEFVQICGSAGIVLYGAVMYQRCALCHSFFYGKNSLGGLVFNFDQGSCRVGDLLGSCNDTGYAVAHVTDLAVKQTAVMGRGLGVALTCLHVVYIGAVLSGDDCGNTV